MEQFKFVWNQPGQPLLPILQAGFAVANTADMAVAFLTDSGLASLHAPITDFLGRGGKLRVVVGTDFWLTEPESLRWLVRQVETSSPSQLYLMDALPQSIFHPKVYLFETGEAATLAIGSSNLTSGGLANNLEADLIGRLPTSSPVIAGIKAIIDEAINSGRAKLADRFSVGEYARLYEVHHRHLDPAIRQAEEAADQELTTKVIGLNEQRIRYLVAEYLADPKEQRDYARRQHNYDVARRSLDLIASEETDSEAKFAVLYSALVAGPGNEGAFHSGSLFRHKNQVIPQWREVQKLITYVRDHPNLSPKRLFAEVKRLAAPVYGLGINVPTEIMNTFYPDHCAVLNQNPRNSLMELGLSAKYPEPNSFRADDYYRFVGDIRYIKQLAGFDTMGQADHFLNYIYWRFVNPQ